VDEEERKNEWQADGYRAIGRWWVQFSRLIGGMRSTMEHRLRKPDDPGELVLLPFHGAPSRQIIDAFFGMSRLVGDLDEAEANIANQLQNECRTINDFRTKMGHGDWQIGLGPEDGEDPTIRTYLMRLYPNAPHHRVDTLTARDLDAKSDRLEVLIRMVYPFGYIALGLPLLTVNGLVPGSTYRVRDVLIAENVPRNGKGGNVIEGGPRASELL
jgi:hypothetical protein